MPSSSSAFGCFIVFSGLPSEGHHQAMEMNWCKGIETNNEKQCLQIPLKIYCTINNLNWIFLWFLLNKRISPVMICPRGQIKFVFYFCLDDSMVWILCGRGGSDSIIGFEREKNIVSIDSIESQSVEVTGDPSSTLRSGKWSPAKTEFQNSPHERPKRRKKSTKSNKNEIYLSLSLTLCLSVGLAALRSL